MHGRLVVVVVAVVCVVVVLVFVVTVFVVTVLVVTEVVVAVAVFVVPVTVVPVLVVAVRVDVVVVVVVVVSVLVLVVSVVAVTEVSVLVVAVVVQSFSSEPSLQCSTPSQKSRKWMHCPPVAHRRSVSLHCLVVVVVVVVHPSSSEPSLQSRMLLHWYTIGLHFPSPHTKSSPPAAQDGSSVGAGVVVMQPAALVSSDPSSQSGSPLHT